jgi:hypothetical protein
VHDKKAEISSWYNKKAEVSSWYNKKAERAPGTIGRLKELQIQGRLKEFQVKSEG